MQKVLNSVWFNYPNCIVNFDRDGAEVTQKGCIGIVTVKDTNTGKIKQYIGIGEGQNKCTDELLIMKYGIPFYGTV